MDDVRRTQKRDRFIIGYLIAFTLIIYSNTLHVPFVFDDLPNILERKDLHLQQLTFDAIVDTFTKDTDDGEMIHRPVSNLTLALNFYIGGFNVTGYHIVNISIHMVTAAFLFKVILLMLAARKDRFSENERYLIAGISALLWAIHPIQIQAVTYIVQRMASLAAMFYIIGIWAYLRFRLFHSRNYLLLLLAALMAILAVLSKQNAVMFPVGIFLIEWLIMPEAGPPRGGTQRIAMICCLVFGAGLMTALAIYGMDVTSLFDNYADKPFAPLERVLTQPRAVFFYLYQMIALMPEHYCIDHAFPKSTALFDPPATFLAILGLLTLIVLAVSLRKRYSLACFAILFFLSHHAVESTVLPLQLVFEHRNYLPSLFLFLLPALAINWLLLVYRRRSRFIYIIIVLVTICFFMFVGMCTHVRNYDWRSRETIWKDASNKYPGITRPYHNLGFIYQCRGEYQKALDTYEIALTRHDHDWRLKKILTLGNMAEIYYQRKAYEKTAAALERAAEIATTVTGDKDAIFKMNKKKYMLLLSKAYAHTRPSLAGKTINRLIHYTQEPGTLSDLFHFKGRFALQQGNPRDARTAFQQALRNDPDNTAAYLNLGVTATVSGDLEKGRRYLDRFINSHPDHAPAYLYLSENRLLAGQPDAARATAEEYITRTDIRDIENLIENIRAHDPETLPLVNPRSTLAFLKHRIDSVTTTMMIAPSQESLPQ